MINVTRRRELFSSAAIIIALVLFIAGVRSPDYGEYWIIRSIYYAAAAVVVILGLMPWTREYIFVPNLKEVSESKIAI
ncbi:MAG: hypothetical protein ACE5I5_14385 [Candidatus Heimdallarchaeota archaeon]